MATLSKTIGTQLLACQALANNARIESAAQDVSTKFGVRVFVHIGRDVVTALTNPVRARIQASAKSSGNDQWFTVAAQNSGLATAATNTLAASGNEAGNGDSVALAFTAGTALTIGDLVFIENSSIANSEFAEVRATSASAANLIDDLTNTQNNSTIINKADFHVFDVDCTEFARIRLIIDTYGTGQAVNVEAHMVSADSIG